MRRPKARPKERNRERQVSSHRPTEPLLLEGRAGKDDYVTAKASSPGAATQRGHSHCDREIVVI